MNRFLGYLLSISGLVTFVFFLNYKGTSIPVKELWFVLSIFTIGAGSYLIVKQKFQNQDYQTTDNDRSRLINQLKSAGDRIRVTLDNCEVKTRVFQQEIISKSIPSRTETLDALYDSNRNYKTQEIKQTYIVFYKQFGDRNYKFISQATSVNADTLKRYMDSQEGIDLYIDKTNPNNFYFDMPFVQGNDM